MPSIPVKINLTAHSSDAAAARLALARFVFSPSLDLNRLQR
jgi:hypothetical protein